MMGVMKNGSAHVRAIDGKASKAAIVLLAGLSVLTLIVVRVLIVLPA